MNSIWALWISGWCALSLQTSLEDIYEGHKEMRVLPMQDTIGIRVRNEEVANFTDEKSNPFQSGGGDQEWIEEAIKDIAYYLRGHKFNEYDRRYEVDYPASGGSYHREYPRPPLRNLHWEVHKFCVDSFLVCVKYLWRRVQETGLRRADDTSIVIQEQHWKIDTNEAQIGIVDAECQKLKMRDNILADPFQGPLERFQWRTTAIYFMCWYTMNEVEHLRHITETCDNFASCLDLKFGARNRDYRANDDTPFACAMYSFCPDSCCRLRYISMAEECWQRHDTNPCFAASATDRQCMVNRSENVDFTEAVLNHWNVTCSCPKMGFIWDSKYGLCVDVDECMRGTHTCKKSEGEACLNTQGGFKCICKWGYTWNEGKCTPHEAVVQIKLTALKTTLSTDDALLERSYLRRLYKYLKRMLVNSTTTSSSSSISTISSYWHCFIITFTYVLHTVPLF